MSEPSMVVVELAVWDVSKVHALLDRIERDDCVLSVRVLSK